MSGRWGAAAVGVLLGVVGAALLAWGLGAALVPGLGALPAAVAVPALVRVAGEPWTVWAVAAAGTAAGLGALALLPALRPATPPRWLRLAGSGPTGRLTLDLPAVAATLAEALRDTVGVESATPSVVTQRGRLVLQVELTVDVRADLVTLVEATERVAREVQGALVDLPVTHRVLVRTAR